MIADYIKMMTQFEIPTNPFPGLRPFEFSESLLYFGRDGQSEQLLKKLGNTRFMAVVGTSGSGKSSLVRAGLLPALFGGFMTTAGSDWHVAIMRPSNDPLGNLARAVNDSGVFGSSGGEEAKLQATMIEATLRRGSLGLVEAVRQARLPANENLLVVADQFEELFRFAQVAESDRYQDEAAAFVKLLLEASGQREVPIYVILTMRSDFLGDCSLFWDLPEAINEGQYLIPRLTRDQRREAITGPIAVCGADVTPRLVNRLLNDMGDNQDQLPILQHALMRTWDRWREENRDTDPIDLRHYEAVGEMSTALSIHADEAYNELPDERSREIAERVFKALTEKGADNREIRRPVELRELCALVGASEAEAIAVIEVFRREGRSFLMPPAEAHLGGESLIDISHESLIRNWERLKGWVDEEARSARLYRRLAETAALHGKGEAGLFRDPDLQLALDWRERSKPNKTWARRYHPEFDAAMNFLDASREARDKEARDREAQRRKEIKRTRLTALIFALAFLFSVAALVFANSKRVEANTKRAEADESNEKLERTLADLGAALQDAKDKRKDAIDQTIIAKDALKVADDQRREAKKQADVARKESIAARIARDEADKQARIASDNAGKANRALVRANDEQMRAQFQEAKAREEAEKSRQLLYSANINLAQEAYKGGDIQRARQLLEEDTSEQAYLRGFEYSLIRRLVDREKGTLDAGKGVSNVFAFSPSPGNRVLAIARDKSVKLLNASSKQELGPLLEHPDFVTAMVFSRDGKTLATGSKDKIVRLWSVGSNRDPITLPGHNESITALAFSSDGKTLATASGDDGLSGKSIATGSGDDGFSGSVKLWDAVTHRVKLTIPGVGVRVRALAFSPNGKTLAIALEPGFKLKPLIYDIDSRQIETPFDVEGSPSLAFSPDGSTLAAGTQGGGGFKLFDTATKKEIAALTGFWSGMVNGVVASIPNAIAFSPDGKMLAAGCFNTLRLYDITGLREFKPPALIASLSSKKGRIDSISFSPDSKMLAMNDSNEIRLLNTETDREFVELGKHLQGVSSAVFSPDNRTLATLNDYQGKYALKMWDTASEEEIKLPDELSKEARAVAFSPNGKYVAAITESRNKIELWDVASRNLLAALSDGSQIQSVAVSPDGRTLSTISAPKRDRSTSNVTYDLKLWDAASPGTSVILNDSVGFGPSISFSPDGRTLVCSESANTAGIIQLWDVATRKVATLQNEDIRVIKAITFSSDGKRFAIVGSKHLDTPDSVELWDAVTHKQLDTLAKGFYSPKVFFSPDGKKLALVGSSDLYDTKVRFWDNASSKWLDWLKGDTKGIYTSAFSNDGKLFASGHDSGAVKLWSTSTYRLLAQFDNKEPVTSIAFSPDSSMLITGGSSGAVKLWKAAAKE